MISIRDIRPIRQCQRVNSAVTPQIDPVRLKVQTLLSVCQPCFLLWFWPGLIFIGIALISAGFIGRKRIHNKGVLFPQNPNGVSCPFRQRNITLYITSFCTAAHLVCRPFLRLTAFIRLICSSFVFLIRTSCEPSAKNCYGSEQSQYLSFYFHPVSLLVLFFQTFIPSAFLPFSYSLPFKSQKIFDIFQNFLKIFLRFPCYNKNPTILDFIRDWEILNWLRKSFSITWLDFI